MAMAMVVSRRVCQRGTDLLRRHSSPSWRVTRPMKDCRMYTAQASSTQFESLKSLITNGQPSFSVKGDNVQVLSAAPDFLETLKDGVRRAKRRVVLSSLYLGNGPAERELMEMVYAGCRDNPNLKVDILMDYYRGSRGKPGERSIDVVSSLVDNFPKQVRIHLYKTPEVRGWKKRLPPPFTESFCVQHIKAYIFDDDLLMTGANFNETYFVNRQDRYLLARKAQGASDWYHSLVETLQDFSMELCGGGSISSCTPSPEHYDEFSSSLKERVLMLLKEHSSASSKDDTLIVPTIQMGLIGITNDEDMTVRILKEVSSRGTHIHMASAYFNFTERYRNVILDTPDSTQISIVAAAPQANGFHDATGVRAMVPEGYSILEQKFYDKIQPQDRNRIKIREWNKPGETFHAKGIWLQPKESDNTTILTTIGSPNYGHRSVVRDLESQIVLLTSNQALRIELEKERDALFADNCTVEVDSDLFKSRNHRMHVRALAHTIVDFM